MIGETVGAYNIVSELGRGGMGVVYLAEHRHMGRRAAIKFLMPELSERGDRLQRFFLEARAASLVEHDGIVRVFDCDVHANGSAYIVMEYLAGQNLQQFLGGRRGLPASEAASIMVRVVDALAAAHEKGIVHRDLKPENIFVLSYPPGGIKILDFGVAKLSQAIHNSPSRTQSGALLGTPLYMSPEQARGSGLVDARADVYSTGCILFEMLTGHPPFTYGSANELLLAHLGEAPPSLDPSLPGALRAMIEGMLAKDPAERPSLREQVIPILQAVITGRTSFFEGIPASTAVMPVVGHPSPVDAYAPSPVGLMAPGMQRQSRSGLRFAGMLVVLGAIAGGVGWWKFLQDDKSGLATAPAGTPPTATATNSPEPGVPPAAGAPASERAGKDQAVPGAGPAGLPSALPSASTTTTASAPPSGPTDTLAAAPGRRAATASRVPPPRNRARATVKPTPLTRGAVASRAGQSITEIPTARFTLATDPPGSYVCLPNVSSRVGVTNGTIELPSQGDNEKTTFVLYRPGYHLERVMVSGGEPRTVKLRPLTEDDLAPLPPCR